MELKKVKYTMLICGCLCIVGMSGPIFRNDLLWFIAVIGYAIGTPIICIQMIRFYVRLHANGKRRVQTKLTLKRLNKHVTGK